MRGFGVPAALVACALLAGCAENKDQGAKGKGSPGNSSAVVRIRATGSSFVERMMKKWSSSFEAQGARVDYQATGSGKGVQDRRQQAKDHISCSCRTNSKMSNQPEGRAVYSSILSLWGAQVGPSSVRNGFLHSGSAFNAPKIHHDGIRCAA